jgi:hypothetical protein
MLSGCAEPTRNTFRLVDFRAAALNEDNQHDDEQNTCDNLNDRGRIHGFLLF